MKLLKTMCKPLKTYGDLRKNKFSTIKNCCFKGKFAVFSTFSTEFSTKTMCKSIYTFRYIICLSRINFKKSTQIRQNIFSIFIAEKSYTNCIKNERKSSAVIKGVNKQILEVTNTENPYFDKIIFFVKPEYNSLDRKKLQKEAETVAAVTQKPPKARISKKRVIMVVSNSVLFTLAGFAISFLLTTFA